MSKRILRRAESAAFVVVEAGERWVVVKWRVATRGRSVTSMGLVAVHVYCMWHYALKKSTSVFITLCQPSVLWSTTGEK